MLPSTSAYQSCTGSQRSRIFSQGKPVAPLLVHAGFNKLVLLFLRFSGNQNGLATLHAVQAEGSSCITSTLCPEPCRQVCHRCFLGFLVRFFLVWDTSFSVWLSIHSSRQLSEPPIFKSMPFPKRALWLAEFPYSQSPQLVRPSFELQDC